MKNQFQDVVDHIRTFWVNVEAALADPNINVLRGAEVKDLSARIAYLTTQLEGYVLNFTPSHPVSNSCYKCYAASNKWRAYQPECA